MFEGGSANKKKKNAGTDLSRIKKECQIFQKRMKRKIEQEEKELKSLMEFGKKTGMIKNYDHMKLISRLHSGKDAAVIGAANNLGLLLQDMDDQKTVDSIETALGIALKDTANEQVAKSVIGSLKMIARKSKNAEDRIRWASGLHPSEKIRRIAKQALKTASAPKKNETDEKEEWKRKFREKVNDYRIKNGKTPAGQMPIAEKKKDGNEEFRTRMCNALSMVASAHSCADFRKAYRRLEKELGPEEVNILMKIAKETESGELMLPVRALNSIGIEMAIRLLREEDRLLPDLKKYGGQE